MKDFHNRREKRGRALVVAIFLFFLFSVLIIQYYRIQIQEESKWRQVARGQHHLIVKEPFKRGRFLSNTALNVGIPETEQPFATDVLKYHLYIDPMQIPEKCRKEIAEKLKEEVQIDREIISHFKKRSRSRKIASWITREDQLRIQKWWYPYAKKHKIASNAVYFLKDYKRSYPFGKMLGQVLHTVRDIRDPKTGQAIPTGGLEIRFDSLLQGKMGERFLMRSPKYELDRNGDHVESEHGCDIYLTINHCLQAICEEELAKGVKKVNGKGGWCVMMDPHTGEVMAMAHYPFFDLENYSSYYSDEKRLDMTRSKAISDCFEPGSTMKAISCAIALNANDELEKRGRKPLFSPHEMMRTDNHQFPGRKKPLRDVRTHKYLNMYLAIQKSSNVYAARLMQRVVENLGAEWYAEQLKEVFGFGKKTEIELPYENVGLVPEPGRLHANGTLEWSLPTPYSLAMGHNITANAVQMVRAFSVFANGGYFVEPTIVSKIVKSDGEILLDNLRDRPKKRVLSSEVAEMILTAMRYSTKPGGSAHLADIPGYTEAGKTGTTEKIVNGAYSKNTHISSFIGIAPATHPRFVLIVVVDEPQKRYIEGFGTTHFGGKCAAPIFREIGKRSLEFLGVDQDDPFGYTPSDPRCDPEKAKWQVEVERLKSIYKRWNE